MIVKTARSFSQKRPSRPYSAMTSTTHRTEYRLTDNDALNQIRSSIHQTFDGQSRSLKQIKQLTSKTSSRYSSKRIQRLCQQFNIGPSRRSLNFSSDVDVEFIAKRYVSSKSKEKRKISERDIMKQEIAKVASRHRKKQHKSFFKFDPVELRKMQHKQRMSNDRRIMKQHPYLKMYEQSQIQALANLSQHQDLRLDKMGVYPQMTEPQDWQNYQKQIKKIYTGVRTLRKDTFKKSNKKLNSSRDNLFIT